MESIFIKGWYEASSVTTGAYDAFKDLTTKYSDISTFWSISGEIKIWW